MKALKAAGLAVGAIVALAAAAAIAVVLFVDPNRFRGVIQDRVLAATGHPLVIAGAMKLSVFPWLALDIGSVTLGNPAGFGAGPLFSAERVRVGARLWPLLHGDLEARDILVDGLAISLVRHADGHTNWENLGRGTTAGGSAPSRGLTGLSIAGLEVTHASLALRDETDKSLTRISGLEVHAGALANAKPTDLAVAASIDSGDGTPAIHLELSARTTIDFERGLATLEALRLSGQRLPAAPGSMPTPFSLASPRLAIDWRAESLAPATLEGKIGELSVSAEVGGRELFGARILEGRLRVPEQSARKAAESLGAKLPATRNAAAFSRCSASARMRLAQSSFALEDLDAMLDGAHLRGRLSIDATGVRALDVDLHVDAIDVDGYRAPAAAESAAAKPPAPAPLPLALLRSITARGSVALDRVTIGGLPLTAVSARISARGGLIDFESNATAFGGNAKGEVHLDATREQAAVLLTETIRGVDVGAAVKAYAKSDRVSGRANAEAKLAGSGATAPALVDALAGPITFDVRDGALEGLDVTYEIERAQALLQGAAIAPRAGPARTPFRELSGRSRLERGVVTTDSLQLETEFLRVTGSGTFRLADQAVDWALTARVQGSAAASATKGLAGLQSLDIPISVTGNVRDYTVRPDLAGLAKGRARQELDKRKDELRDKLKDKLKELLGR